MKRLLLFCLIIITSLTAADPTGLEILNKIIDLMNPENAKAVMEQTIVTTSGDKRTFKYETYMGNRGESAVLGRGRFCGPSSSPSYRRRYSFFQPAVTTIALYVSMASIQTTSSILSLLGMGVGIRVRPGP